MSDTANEVLTIDPTDLQVEDKPYFDKQAILVSLADFKMQRRTNDKGEEQVDVVVTLQLEQAARTMSGKEVSPGYQVKEYITVQPPASRRNAAQSTEIAYNTLARLLLAANGHAAPKGKTLTLAPAKRDVWFAQLRDEFQTAADGAAVQNATLRACLGKQVIDWMTYETYPKGDGTMGDRQRHSFRAK